MKKFVVALLLCCWGGLVQAASVLQIPFDKIVLNAETAFEARVVGTKSRWNEKRTAIVTDVTFSVGEVLKGFAAPTMTLTFSGGVVDGMRMSVSGLRMPSVGEQGVYFVETTTRTQMSPIVGWNQGHFLLEANGNDRRVLTSNGLPVVDFNASIVDPSGMNESIAAGLDTRQAGGQAMSLSRFKAEIRDVLQRAEDVRRVAQ